MSMVDENFAAPPRRNNEQETIRQLQAANEKLQLELELAKREARRIARDYGNYRQATDETCEFLNKRIVDLGQENEILKRGVILQQDTLEGLRRRAFKLLEGIEAVENLQPDFPKNPVRWFRNDVTGEFYVHTRQLYYAQQLSTFIGELL